ncbi:hypothetical protein DSL72_006782, partial [Monilinia vaccinii-corymbosi]
SGSKTGEPGNDISTSRQPTRTNNVKKKLAHFAIDSKWAAAAKSRKFSRHDTPTWREQSAQRAIILITIFHGRYPKHVWSPAGGWYAQPSNWKANTAIMMTVIVGITAGMWKLSAEREYRTKFPEEGRFFPSRYWSKQIKEHEAEKKKSIADRVVEKVTGN